MKLLLIVWLLLGEVPHRPATPPGAYRVASDASRGACLHALRLWRGLDAAVCTPVHLQSQEPAP